MQALKMIALGILIGLIGTALILLIASPPQGMAVDLLPTSTKAPITIYVNGEVANPGLYTLPPGSRLADALAAAGGALPDAALANLNLAQLLLDGQQILVPKQTNTTLPTPTGAPIAYPIELNTATLEQLDQLPGIGPSKAQDIITYRQKIGAFDKIEQIMDVPGIGPVLFEKIKDLIIVLPGN